MSCFIVLNAYLSLGNNPVSYLLRKFFLQLYLEEHVMLGDYS